MAAQDESEPLLCERGTNLVWDNLAPDDFKDTDLSAFEKPIASIKILAAFTLAVYVCSLAVAAILAWYFADQTITETSIEALFDSSYDSCYALGTNAYQSYYAVRDTSKASVPTIMLDTGACRESTQSTDADIANYFTDYSLSEVHLEQPYLVAQDAMAEAAKGFQSNGQAGSRLNVKSPQFLCSGGIVANRYGNLAPIECMALVISNAAPVETADPGMCTSLLTAQCEANNWTKFGDGAVDSSAWECPATQTYWYYDPTSSYSNPIPPDSSCQCCDRPSGYQTNSLMLTDNGNYAPREYSYGLLRMANGYSNSDIEALTCPNQATCVQPDGTTSFTGDPVYDTTATSTEACRSSGYQANAATFSISAGGNTAYCTRQISSSSTGTTADIATTATQCSASCSQIAQLCENSYNRYRAPYACSREVHKPVLTIIAETYADTMLFITTSFLVLAFIIARACGTSEEQDASKAEDDATKADGDASKAEGDATTLELVGLAQTKNPVTNGAPNDVTPIASDAPL